MGPVIIYRLAGGGGEGDGGVGEFEAYQGEI